MDISCSLVKVRSYFYDKISLGLFDLHAEAAINGQNFSQIVPDLELKQLSPTLKADFKAMSLLKPPLHYFMFGGGGHCEEILQSPSDMYVLQLNCPDFERFEGIIDNNIKSDKKYGLPVLSYEEFKSRYPNKDTVLICISLYNYEAAFDVRNSLVDDGYVSFIHRESIDVCKRQYFDYFFEKNLFTEDEVFVQAGCADGFNQRSFLDYVGDSYRKMITFEPSSDYDLCVKNLSGIRDVEVVRGGLGEKTCEITFSENEYWLQGSSISSAGNKIIKIFSLDEFIKEEKVTFIALDVEGYELNALRGAANIIKSQKPKLAISVYHKPEDIYEIPLYIKALAPDYKLSLRNYGRYVMDDTILYAYI